MLLFDESGPPECQNFWWGQAYVVGLIYTPQFEIVSNRIVYCIMLCIRRIINKTEHLYHFISALLKFEETSNSENSKKTKIFLDRQVLGALLASKA